jgi:FAD synthase
VPLRRLSTPLSGVFAVRVHGLADGSLAGMANLGTRPTVNGNHKLLEVHLFDFDADIYGRHVSVEFVHKLRDERKFDSLEALKAQIVRDGDTARGLLGD